MKKYCIAGVLAGLLSLNLGAALADSPVWKIVKDNRQIFLGGSVHFLGEKDYPLPAGFDDAYRRSRTLVLETDLKKLQSPEFAPIMAARLTYPDDRTIRGVVSAETWKALRDFFAGYGIEMSQVESFRPGLLASTMVVIELQRLNLAGAGVDQHYESRASSDGKKIRFLESIEQQVGFLANLGSGREDEMIRYSLMDVSQLQTLWQAMISAWRNGDLEKLHALAYEPLQQRLPGVAEELITRRNHAWLPLIERLFADAPVEFVVVGALHLSGSDGLLALLAGRGYRVEQLP